MNLPYDYFILSVMFGTGYLILTSIIGATAFGVLCKIKPNYSNGNIWIISPFLGVLIHVIISTFTFYINNELSGYVIWILLTLHLLMFNKSVEYIKISGFKFKPIIFCGLYALVAFIILVLYQQGHGKGDDWFWTIYNLTSITPGDSPGSMHQAQYILHGKGLINSENFSLFDRPFFGGLITLFSLSSVNVFPSDVYYKNTEFVNLLYIYLWLVLNSLIILGLYALIKEINIKRRVSIIYICVMASPFFVFNTIGLWPKLYATYLAICSLLLFLNKKYILALFLSGFSFYTHGSFLWSDIAFSCVVLYFYLFEEEKCNKAKFIKLSIYSIVFFSFPLVWFICQYFLGYKSGLQSYYLYDVSVNYGFYHTKDEMAKTFYESTTLYNLTILPTINIIKSLLPYELIKFVVDFSYKKPEYLVDFGDIFKSLFDVNFRRPLFSIGMLGSLVFLLGFKNEFKNKYVIYIVIVTFLLLPFIPGMLIYRRNDHFITTIMMFSLIPVIIMFAYGIEKIKSKLLFLILLAMFCEFYVIYYSRFPIIRYHNEFHEYYLVIISLLLIGCFIFCFRTLLNEHSNSKLSISNYFYQMDKFKILNVLLLILFMISGLIGPKIVTKVFDHGFEKNHRQDILLLNWDDIEGNRDLQPYINTQLDGRKETMWLNAGQSLYFKNLPIADNSIFFANVKLNSLWTENENIPNLSFFVKISAVEHPDLNEEFKFNFGDSRSDLVQWNNIKVNLEKFSGHVVNIEVKSISSDKGIWTYWNNIKITNK